MPTSGDVNELLENTDVFLVPVEGEEISASSYGWNDSAKWHELNWSSQPSSSDIKGIRCVNKAEQSKFVFLPAAGDADCGSIYDVDQYVYLWLSSLHSEGVQHAWFFGGLSDYGVLSDGFRYFGLSVRGVLDPK